MFARIMKAGRTARRFTGATLLAVLLTALLAASLLSACATCNGYTDPAPADPASMAPLSTVVSRLTKQAQGLLLTGEADPARPDALPGLVLARDDEAREMLAGYQLRAAVLRDANGRPRAVLLLCTRDGGSALIERMDCLNSVRKGQHWQARPLPPCEVTFRDPAVACADN